MIVRFIFAVIFLCAGMFMLATATFGVNRFNKALNRIHAAALGDTLGIFFCTMGLVIWKGLSAVSGKMLVVVIFFWLASPVASHMLGNLDLEINENPGDLIIEHHEKQEEEAEK
ncbi:MAG: monovalent cation/H(+) antiporter subunit G [Lachnospiraceae bacterium]|nr:monovalent cation/H(+) antiporter subunit G [Lachnospiraceae bacterium]